jgi:alpha-tubulin suppressor-like RCC1 family protein
MKTSLALAAVGTLFVCGDNLSGELGDGTVIKRSTFVPAIGTGPWIDVAGGGSVALAVASDGTLYSTGSNFFGAGGTGTAAARSSFLRVLGI